MRVPVNFVRAWIQYQWLYWRLVWRAHLSRDFAAVMATPGQMRRSEVRCIYDLAAACEGTSVIVEIGSYRGLSTVALARGSQQGARSPVYAIDPHDYLDPGTYPGSGGMAYTTDDTTAFFQNMLLASVCHLVRPISMLSWEVAKAWDQPIGLLWIDGNHEYAAVKRDWDDWSRFVTPHGVVALHDAAHPDAGPFRVVQEACATGEWQVTMQVEKVAVLQRV